MPRGLGKRKSSSPYYRANSRRRNQPATDSQAEEAASTPAMDGAAQTDEVAGPSSAPPGQSSGENIVEQLGSLLRQLKEPNAPTDEVCVTHGSVGDESTLQRVLLANYSRNVRPNETVQVLVSLSLNNIIELDIVDQRMVLSGSIIAAWIDDRLKWNPNTYNDVDTLYFKADEIWRPLMVLVNSADDISALGDKGDEKSIPLVVSNNGNVFWLAPAFFKSLCPADVSLFPFDTQKCELTISSWMFDNTKVNFNLITNKISLDNYKENGEYKLIRTFSEFREYRAYGNDPWSIVVFGFELQRRYSYYVINIVIPVLFLETLGVVVFLVPASSGEKLAYALTLLLSLIVMTTVVAEKIPSTSTNVPVLSIYVLEGVALAVAEVLVTVYVLQLHRWHEDQRTPSKGYVMLASFMAKFTCPARNTVSVINDAENDDKLSGVETTPAVVEPPVISEKASIVAWGKENTMTYRDIAALIEKACCLMFALLTALFSLQALFTVVFS